MVHKCVAQVQYKYYTLKCLAYIMDELTQHNRVKPLIIAFNSWQINSKLFYEQKCEYDKLMSIIMVIFLQLFSNKYHDC